MRWLFFVLMGGILLGSCNLIVELKDPPEECGDSLVHGEELCDGGNLNGQTCVSLGYSGGELTCTGSCQFDTSQCLPPTTCGDGEIQGIEECDGEDLGEGSCETLRYYGGDLACGADCRYDTTDCEVHGICGDGVSQSEEECDGVDLRGMSCSSLEYYGGTLSCKMNCTFNTEDCEAFGSCGDGALQAAEECDGTLLNGETCLSLGYSGGELSCASDCSMDTSGCLAPETCGDSAIQSPEECDGADLGGATCISEGFHGGTLLCGSNCTFDRTSCALVGRCGDVVLQGDFEECDGSLLNGATCESLGFYGGTLVCDGACAYDTTDCESSGWCGDAIVQSEEGETCDGTYLGTESCQSIGYYGGEILCTECQPDITDCEAMGRCGDGLLQGNFGESCDGTDLGGSTCETMGYYGGDLTCDASCLHVMDQCESFGRCGDTIVQGGNGETCDGTELQGASCESLGYYGGTLTCDASCLLSLSDCESHGRCGDGVIQSPETCDGTEFAGATCSSIGAGTSGTLTCDASCLIDSSACF